MTERQPWTARTVQEFLDGSPHIAFLALVCEKADASAGTVTLRMPLRAELARSAPGEQFHGGPVASFIDTAGDFAISLLVSAPVPTVNLRVDYLRPATGPFLLAHATARRAGRTVGVADVDVLDSAGRLVAIGRGTYATAAG